MSAEIVKLSGAAFCPTSWWGLLDDGYETNMWSYRQMVDFFLIVSWSVIGRKSCVQGRWRVDRRRWAAITAEASVAVPERRLGVTGFN